VSDKIPEDLKGLYENARVGAQTKVNPLYCSRILKLIKRIARLEAENSALSKEVENFRFGENYIKQYLNAKEMCAGMYPPEEVYTEQQLSNWAEEHGYELAARGRK
jgi:hypothetical protein